MNTDNSTSERSENLRAEYAALSNHYNLIDGFRITLLGFYLAAVALLVSDVCSISRPRSIIGIILTAAVYLFELRSNDVFKDLAKRGIYIERHEWKFGNSDKKPRSHYSRSFEYFIADVDAKERERVTDGNNQEQQGRNEEEPINRIATKRRPYFTRRRVVSHTWALNFLYASVLLFFLYAFFFPQEMSMACPPSEPQYLIIITPTPTSTLVTITPSISDTSTPLASSTLTNSPTQMSP